MAYTDNLNELWGIPEIEAQQKRAIELVEGYLVKVTDVSQKIRGLEFGFGDTKQISGLKDIFKEADSLTKQQADNIKKLSDAYLNLAKSKTESSKQSKIELDMEQSINKEIEKNNKLREKAEAQLKKEQNAYEQLKRKYKEAADEAKRLYIEKGKDNDATKEAITLAQKYYTQLSAAEQAVGQYQRQVGNYNVVGAQFNQLLRELPNLAISPQTFLISLTNNISYFVEAIAAAKAEGQTMNQIFGTITSSLTGVVGMVNIAIVAFTFLSQAMNEGEKDLDEYHKKLDEAEQNIRKYNSQLEKTADITSEGGEYLVARLKGELAQLNAKGAALDVIYAKEQEIRRAEIRDLRTRYETMRLTDPEKAHQIKLRIIDKENEIEAARFKFQKDNEDSLRDLQAKYLKAKNDATAKSSMLEMEMLRDKNKAIFDDEENSLERRVAAYGAYENALRVIAEAEYKNELKNLEVERNKEKEKFKNNAAALTLIDKTYAQKRLETQTEYFSKLNDIATEGQKEMYATMRKAQEDNAQYMLDSINNIQENNQLQYNKEEHDLITALGNKQISYKKFEKERRDLQIQYNQKNIDETIAYLEEVLDNEDLTAKDRRKIQEELDKLKVKSAKSANDQIIADEIKRLQKQKEIYAALRQVIESAFSAISTVSQNKTESYIRNLQEEADAKDKATEREKAAIERSGITTEQKELKIAELEAKAEQRRQMYAQKEAERRQRQATFDRDMAILKATIALYVGIAEEISKGGVVGIGTGAAVAAYMATVIAAISSSEVPQYGDGTPIGGHKGGDAIVGERYQPERVTLPDGTSAVISTPTYIKDMPKGTEVMPLSEYAANYPTYNGRGVGMRVIGDNSALVNEMRALGQRIVNMPQTTFNLKNGELYKTVTTGRVRETFINSNMA